MQETSVPVDHTASFDWRSRVHAAGIHLALSAVVAAVAALLVFLVWYPYPYREISGGRELFLLVVSVDVVLGPLITFAVFNRRKRAAELKRDLAVVVVLQLAGLAYGLWTVNLARPAHLVFEADRFRVVHLVEIPPELEKDVPSGMELAPLAGPTVIATRPWRDDAERVEATLMAMQGLHPAARPALWQPYAAARAEVLKAARPIERLKARFPAEGATIDALLQRRGLDAANTAYLPMIGRKADGWTVLLDARTAEVLGFLPLDSF